jgi:hypothetical protein
MNNSERKSLNNKNLKQENNLHTSRTSYKEEVSGFLTHVTSATVLPVQKPNELCNNNPVGRLNLSLRRFEELENQLLTLNKVIESTHNTIQQTKQEFRRYVVERRKNSEPDSYNRQS